MQIKISRLINSFGICLATGTLAAAIITGLITNQIRIGGAFYDKINQGKDLVADILPPPEYVIESFLEATLALNQSKPIAESKARLSQLHKDYDERREFWKKSDLPSELVEKLTKKSDQKVQIFWQQVESQLLPALQQGNTALANEAYAKALEAYEAHRAIIDDVVNDSNALNSVTEAEATARGRTALVVSIAAIGILLLFLIAGVVLINARAVRPLTKITKVMTEISSGNTSCDVPGANRYDEIGEISKSVLVFRDNLVRVKAMEVERIDAEKRSATEREAAMQRVADEFEAAVGGIVRAAAIGDFSHRIDLRGKTGMMLNLGTALNQLGETVSRALDDLVKMLKALASGDLTQRITAAYGGNFAVLKDNANSTATQIGSTLSQIKATAAELTSASSEIAASTTDLSQRTEEQAASLEETSASMEQIAVTVKKNAENAQAANVAANCARSVAERGGEVVGNAVAAMARIEEASHKISDIISVIDEIARQTNLLALNAAVEAARAGDAGRGFAVVASEVRSLAQRSSQAAKDIKQLIVGSNEQVKDGVQLVNSTGAALTELTTSIKDVAGIVAEIAYASNEQADGIEQINKALAQMDDVTQQNSALVEENAATAKTLENRARGLDHRVAYFRVPESLDDAAGSESGFANRAA